MKAMKSKFLILIYSGGGNTPLGRNIVNQIRQAVPGEKIVHVRTMEALVQRCRRLPRDIDVAVLPVNSRNELAGLCTLSGLLEKTKTLLILPERNQALISKAWELKPIYIDFSDSDFLDLSAVILNILKKHHDSLMKLM